MRWLAALASLLLLSAAALALWPRGGARPTRALVPMPQSERELRSSALRALERVVEPAQGAADARAARGAPPALAPSACPDLEAAVAHRAQELRDGTRSLDRDWVSDGELQARAFDLHCAKELARMAAEPARDVDARLAAFSLAAAEPALAGVLEPDPDSLSWLRQRVDEMPSGRLDDSDGHHRRAQGLVAALCLAGLGGPSERARLVEDLASGARVEAALFALSNACADDVAPRLVDALERELDARRGVLWVLVRTGVEPSFPFPDPERARALAAIERWWVAEDDSALAENEVTLAAAALDVLDPEASARLWGVRLDARGLEPEWMHLSLRALARRGTSEDRARLESLMREGELPLRLDVALQVLASAATEGPAAGLRHECTALFADTLDLGGDPVLRLRAVRGLERAGELDPRARAALESAASDPDERVRRAARAALD